MLCCFVIFMLFVASSKVNTVLFLFWKLKKLQMCSKYVTHIKKENYGKVMRVQDLNTRMDEERTEHFTFPISPFPITFSFFLPPLEN